MRNKILIALAVAIVFTSGLLFAVLNGRGQLVTNELLDNPQGIALMVHDGTQYNKATSVSNSFKYVLNRTLTKCEGGGAVVSYNRSTGVIEYSLPTADMCYVYLDLDTTPPTVTSLVLNSGETYSTTKAVPAVLTFPLPEDDWDGYCLTLDSDGSDCTSGNKWKTLGTSPMSVTFDTSDGDQTVYAFIKDIAGNLSTAVSDSIIVDSTAPTGFDYYKVYQILGTRDYGASGYSTTGGKGGSWTTNTNDPIISFNLEDIQGIMGAYIKLGAAVSYNLPIQIFYTTANGSHSETYSAHGSISAGSTEAFIKFNHTATNWTKIRFDIGSSSGLTYTLAELGVFTTSSTESGVSYVNWAGEASTFTRFIATDATSGVESFQYYGDGVPNWTSLNLALSNGLQVSGTTTTGKENWGTTDGRNQTYYFRACDKAGNCTNSLAYNIKYDFSVPTITGASFSGINQLSFTVNDTYSGVSKVCVNQNATSVSGCTWQNVSAGANTLRVTYSNVGTNYIYVRDKAGNVGHSSAITIPNTFATQVMINPTAGLNYSTVYGNLWRYIGSTANNYVCFGTTDKSTCTSNPGVYMYRILGIASDGKIKLIKKTAFVLGTSNDYDYTDMWPSHGAYSMLNGSLFLTNSTYFPSGWADKVATISWKYGTHNSISYCDKNGQTNFDVENSFTNYVSAKIALMYMHDYIWAYSTTGVCGTAQDSCQSSWVFLPNNDSNYSNSSGWSEATMTGADDVSILWYTRKGFYLIHYRGFKEYPANYTDSYRPVFYLNSNVTWKSGTGTASDPYIIT